MSKHIRKNSETKFLVIFVVSGYGLIIDGQQNVVLNAYNKGTGYYQTSAIEYQIREIAQRFENACVIGIFDQSREKYPFEKHTIAFSGEGDFEQIVAKIRDTHPNQARIDKLEQELQELKEEVSKGIRK